MDISAAASSEEALLVCSTLGDLKTDGSYREGTIFEPIENDVSDALDYDTARATGRCILRAVQLIAGTP